MAGINSEEIFSEDEINIDSVFSFVQTRSDMNFPIVVDSERTAVRGEGLAYRLFCGSLLISLKNCLIKQAEGRCLPVSLDPPPFHPFPILSAIPTWSPLAFLRYWRPTLISPFGPLIDTPNELFMPSPDRAFRVGFDSFRVSVYLFPPALRPLD